MSETDLELSTQVAHNHILVQLQGMSKLLLNERLAFQFEIWRVKISFIL